MLEGTSGGNGLFVIVCVFNLIFYWVSIGRLTCFILSGTSRLITFVLNATPQALSVSRTGAFAW